MNQSLLRRRHEYILTMTSLHHSFSTLQHRRTYGQNRINRFRYRVSVDMGRYSPSEFECCLAVWCQWSFLVSSS